MENIISKLATSYILNFACSKLRYNTFQKANNIGADQSVKMCRLDLRLSVSIPWKTGFLASKPI